MASCAWHVYKAVISCPGHGIAMEEDLTVTLARLREEHRRLDEEIGILQAQPYCDQLLLQRLKKRKLWLKDCMVRIESRLIPDLDA